MDEGNHQNKCGKWKKKRKKNKKQKKHRILAGDPERGISDSGNADVARKLAFSSTQGTIAC